MNERFQIDTRKEGCPDSFQTGCVRIAHLCDIPQVLRHEKYSESTDIIYLFSMEAQWEKDSPQIFVRVYRLPDATEAFIKERQSYESLASNFRLPKGQRFDASTLAIASAPLEFRHEAFRVKDGAIRRRIVHIYQSDQYAVTIVFSLASVDFLERKFFRNFVDHYSFIIP